MFLFFVGGFFGFFGVAIIGKGEKKREMETDREERRIERRGEGEDRER